MKDSKGLFSKFEGSQIEKDTTIKGGIARIASHKSESTFVGEGGDIRHTCDTTTSDVVVIGYTFP